MRFHHIGYVVADIEQGIRDFQRSLDAAWDNQIFEDPKQRVKVAFLSTNPLDPSIELVQPLGPGSPVNRFLEKGGGLHHICWAVNDLETALRDFHERGAAVASRPKPALAFGGKRIAWLITSEKLLVELLETDREA
jgi:methylmalonyl-CoA/ethylmalonyl-CoA epimerase